MRILSPVLVLFLGVILATSAAKTRNKKDTAKKDSAKSSDDKESAKDSAPLSTSNSTEVSVICDPENSFTCKNTGHCLPKSFYCDGEADCIDNSDEPAEECAKITKAQKDVCKDQFVCVSKDCIDPKLKCDGKVDCLDGWSDEVGCPNLVSCHKDEGQFLCKSGDLCLTDGKKVCDKKADCPDKSDEFEGCEDSCTNANCSQGCLPDPGQNATGSGLCYCFPGYTQTEHGKGQCQDVDECQFFGACSQKCTNLVGSYQCSCMSGFRLNGNTSCELVEDNATLIFAQGGTIRVHKTTPDALETRPNYTIVEWHGSPVSVTYDARNDFIYWSDAQELEESIWRSKQDGTMKEKVLTTGIILPEGIAFDWIANNIYFTDSNKSHIVVCTANGGNCSVIIQELSKPRDIALHPNFGLLYWTDWGISPSILKAGMDGSIPIAIITENLKWPNGITIDQGNDRIYWTDAGMDRIETATLQGDDRLVVHSTRITHPFGIDVLGDYVYWSDWNLREIQKSHKFDGSNHRTLVKEGYDQLNGLAVFHKANQPRNRKNHCQDSGCSHICTLTPTNSFRCKCPNGMSLDRRNKRKCAVIKAWPHFVVGFNNTLKISPIDAIGGNTFQEYVIPTLGNIVAIATIPFNTTLFLSDLETKKIYSFDTKTRVLTTIVDSVGFAKGLDYDEIGNNLYWVDSMRKTVEVMSLKTRTRVVLFKEIDRPIDIVVAPSVRMLFLAQMGDRGAKIVRMNMNGFNRRVLYRKSRAEPVALTYNVELKQLYWTDAVSETIDSTGIDGNGGYHAVTRAGFPFGITSYHSTIYWADRHTHTLKGKNLATFADERPIFLGDYESMKRGIAHAYNGGMMAKVTIMNSDTGVSHQLLNEHDCSPHRNQCSHICLLAAEEMEGTCICPDHLKLDKDGRSCITLSDKDSPTPAICADGRCRTQLTTKKPSKSSKSKSSNSSKDKDKTKDSDDVGGGKSGSFQEKEKDSKDKVIGGGSDDTPSSRDASPDYFDIPGLDLWNADNDDKGGSSKKKVSKGKSGSKNPTSSPSAIERESRRNLDYDEYDGSPPSEAVVMPDGRIIYPGQSVVQQESDMDKDVVSEGAHPFAIALGVIVLLVLVAVIVGIVLHRRNVHPKVLVRPYVQHWVKYVNQPVQRFFDRGEQLDGGKRHIYDEVYHSPAGGTMGSEHSYSRAYENIDEDSSVNVYEDPGDSHRISYSQTDKLL